MPRLVVSGIYALVAMAALIDSYYSTTQPTQSILFAAGLILAWLAISSYFHWAGNARAIVIRDTNEAKTITEKVKMFEFASKMDPAQVKLLTLYVPSVLIQAGNSGPIFYLDLDDGKIPMAFIRDFIARGNRQYLCPISEYSDGTDERMFAQSFTHYMTTLRFANPAVSNRPAKWIDFTAAMYSLGLSDNTGE